MSDDFVHLHTHTHNSAFDGLGKPAEFCAKVAEMGQSALALTEHGSIRGLYEASVAADAAGIKFIPGAELYLADDASRRGLSDEEKVAIKERHAGDIDAGKVALKAAEKERRERDHVTVWALDDVGLRNLYRLTAWSWTKGYYYRPRVDVDVLCAHAEGLAVSSGCPGGVIAKPLRSPTGTAEAVSRATRLAEVFGDRFLVEIMPHVPEADCVGLAAKLVRVADRFGCTLVATQDAHYPHKHDAPAQEALLCVHVRSKMDAPGRFVFDSREYWLKTRPELEASFAAKIPLLSRATVRKAMDATVVFAERCTARIAKPKAGAYLVAPSLPDGVSDYDAWLMRLCSEGVAERFGVPARDLGAGYLERLRHELRMIRDLNFARYFVAVWEVRAWARSQGIMCGPGRGSGAGSLVCFLLKITDLDPLRHGLAFERFLSPGRVDLPDIDLDFESLRREEIIAHLRELYGEDRVAHISTHNVLGGKRAVRDLARIFGVPEREAAAISALVSNAYEEEAKTEDTLAKVLRETEAGRVFAERYPDLAAVAPRLEGQLRDVGLHAGGIVMAPVPLADIVPLETRAREKGEDDEGKLGPAGGKAKGRVLAVAYDMAGTEAAGLVKLDVLGLTTLSMLRLAFEGARCRPEDVDLEDPLTLEGFTQGRFAGIFQYDTPAARRLCRGYTFRAFSDVAVMTALNRPGPLRTGLAREFMLRAADPSRVESIHPVYDDAMAETHGVPVYQEQVVALARGFGYSAQAADGLRKKIAKKIGLSDEEEKFVAGAMSVGMKLEPAQRLFDSLTGFAAYSFGKSHSYGYGALSFWSLWLKVHHPAEFFAAALRFKSKPEAQMRLAAEARRAGIPVRPPDVNATGDGFRVRRLEGGASEIVGSITDIKGIGEKTAAAVASGAPYSGLLDFYARTAGRKARVTVATFELLARAGALRSVFPHHRFLATNAREIWEGLRSGLEPELVLGAIQDYDEEETARVVGAVWPLYVSLAGHSAFGAMLERARSATSRDLLVPGDPGLAEPGPRVVFGLVTSSRLFPTEDGSRVGRVVLSSADGEELSVRVDSDVLDSSSAALSVSGAAVLAVVWISDRGNASLERAWPVQGVLTGTDTSASWLMAPARTKPRDLWVALLKAAEGQAFAASGELLRVRHHKDRSGSRMITAGLLSERGYGRFFVFASRAGKRDLRGFVPGARVSVRLRRLSGAAARLADAPVEYLSRS